MDNQSSNSNKEILMRLARLEAHFMRLQEYVEDTTLSGDDMDAIEAYKREKKAGKLISHEQLKKELGV